MGADQAIWLAQVGPQRVAFQVHEDADRALIGTLDEANRIAFMEGTDLVDMFMTLVVYISASAALPL